MALTEEKIKIYGKDDSPESFVRFVPEIVDDLEVYSVVNSNDQHCGYVMPELLDFFNGRREWRELSQPKF